MDADVPNVWWFLYAANLPYFCRVLVNCRCFTFLFTILPGTHFWKLVSPLLSSETYDSKLANVVPMLISATEKVQDKLEMVFDAELAGGLPFQVHIVFVLVIVSSLNHTCFFQSLKFMNISTCFPAPRLSQNQNINWRSLPIPTSVAFIGCLNTFNWKCLMSCSQIFPVLLYLRNVLDFIVVFR